MACIYLAGIGSEEKKRLQPVLEEIRKLIGNFVGFDKHEISFEIKELKTVGFSTEESTQPKVSLVPILGSGLCPGISVYQRYELQEMADLISIPLYDAFNGEAEVEVFFSGMNGGLRSSIQPALKKFDFRGNTYRVLYKGIHTVAPGVLCIAYSIYKRTDFDLAVIRVAPGCKTPLQQVMKGEQTIEGYVSGEGKFQLIDSERNETKIIKRTFQKSVTIGQFMKWEAFPNTPLTFFEVCWPPYKEGRFENVK